MKKSAAVTTKRKKVTDHSSEVNMIKPLTVSQQQVASMLHNWLTANAIRRVPTSSPNNNNTVVANNNKNNRKPTSFLIADILGWSMKNGDSSDTNTVVDDQHSSHESHDTDTAMDDCYSNMSSDDDSMDQPLNLSLKSPVINNNSDISSIKPSLLNNNKDFSIVMQDMKQSMAMRDAAASLMIVQTKKLNDVLLSNIDSSLVTAAVGNNTISDSSSRPAANKLKKIRTGRRSEFIASSFINRI
jgi:hypothetical protein